MLTHPTDFQIAGQINITSTSEHRTLRAPLQLLKRRDTPVQAAEPTYWGRKHGPWADGTTSRTQKVSKSSFGGSAFFSNITLLKALTIYIKERGKSCEAWASFF